MEDKHYIAEVGTDIVVDVLEDISDATTTRLIIKKPNDTVVNLAAVLENLTCLKYTVQIGDWDVVGTYLVQAYIVTPTWTGRGETVSFKIYDVFK